MTEQGSSGSFSEDLFCDSWESGIRGMEMGLMGVVLFMSRRDSSHVFR